MGEKPTQYQASLSDKSDGGWDTPTSVDGGQRARTMSTATLARALKSECAVIGCSTPTQELMSIKDSKQLENLRILHDTMRNMLGKKPVFFCSQHRSGAVEYVGKYCAQVPGTGEDPYRIGRVEHVQPESQNRKPAFPQDVGKLLFSERFAAERMAYLVKWYPYDGYHVPWVFDEPPPVVPSAEDRMEYEELLKARTLYEGMRQYHEHCSRSKGWGSDISDLTRQARRQTATLGTALMEWLYFHPHSKVARFFLPGFQALVVLVACVFMYGIWISFEANDLHLSASIMAGAAAVLATTISFLEIIAHLQNVHSPELQLYVVRILFIVPVFSIDCWLSLRFANSPHHLNVYINAVRDVYEAFVIHTFFLFLTACFGQNGSANIVRILAKKPQTPHLFGIQRCIKAPPMGEPFFLFCKYFTLQFVTVKTSLSILEVLLQATGNYEHGNFDTNQGFLYITIGINLSQMLALYALLLFYHALHKDLEPIHPLGKFLSVKLIVFFTFWQSIVISLAVKGGLLHGTKEWEVKNISEALNNFLLCFEMLVASILHTFVFSYKDFDGDRQLVQEARRTRHFDSMVVEVMNPGNLVEDTKDMGSYCMSCACFCPNNWYFKARPKISDRLPASNRSGVNVLARLSGPASSRKPGPELTVLEEVEGNLVATEPEKGKVTAPSASALETLALPPPAGEEVMVMLEGGVDATRSRTDGHSFSRPADRRWRTLTDNRSEAAAGPKSRGAPKGGEYMPSHQI